MIKLKDIYNLAKAVDELSFIVGNDEYYKDNKKYKRFKARVIDELGYLKTDEIIYKYKRYKELEKTTNKRTLRT